MLTTTKYEELSHLITDRNVLRELRGVSKQIWKLASVGERTRLVAVYYIALTNNC